MSAATRRRVSAEQTREDLLQAGLTRLEEQGLTATLESVSLEQMVRHADVPRSSAYAAWQTVADDDQTPQMAFRRELLHRAIVGAGIGARNNAPMLDAVRDLVGLQGQIEPAALASEMIRVAVEAQFLDASARRSYRTGQALTAVATSVPEDEIDLELLEWLREVELAYVDEMSQSFRAFADLVEFAPDPELDGPRFWHQFTTAVLALGEGLLPRLRTAEPEVLFGLRGPGLDGPAAWTLFGVGMDALFQRFFVPTSAGDAC